MVGTRFTDPLAAWVFATSRRWGRTRALRRFRRLEKLFSAIWGLLLLADCAARLAGAYTLPVTTMVWLSTVLTLGAVGLAVMAGGAAAGRPICGR